MRHLGPILNSGLVVSVLAVFVAGDGSARSDLRSTRVAAAPTAPALGSVHPGTPLAPPLDSSAIEAGADESWWSTVTAGIARDEYRVASTPDGIQSPNRAHDFRTRYREAGIEVSPRTEGIDWSFAWETARFGRPGALESVGPASPEANGSRVTYRRPQFDEWYENSPKGVEQGFTVHAAPPGEGPLCIAGRVAGTLRAEMSSDHRAVDLLDAHGTRALRYSELHVWDANGEELPSRLTLQGTELTLLVEDEGATYPLTIDPLVTSPSWTAESDQADAVFGASAATAGDVNGDGFSDVIVGAYAFDNGQADEGRAFVYHGSATGLSVTAAWTAEGDQASAYFGISAATAGDVNGDGYSDVIVGAAQYSNGESAEGRAFVYHGSPTGLAATAAWTAEGDQNSAVLGWAVATAGDVNNDGYSDVVVGAYQYTNGESFEGRAYVYHGSASGLAAGAAWTAEGGQNAAYFGYSVASAGDVNGDGYGDVVVGAYRYDNGQTDEGRAHVYHGSATGLAAAAAWTAEVDQATARFGYSVATAGDVNGDGYSDVLIGADRYDNGEADEGRAYVYHGSATGLAAAAAWTAESNQASASFGVSVATAGDINGDGYADVLIAADRYDDGETNEGRAYAYLGSPTGLAATASWTVEGNQASASLGYPVGTAGDVNGDGYSDVIVGAPTFDNGQSNEGRAYVYHGSAAGLAASAAWTAEGDQFFAAFGQAVANAGDVNGDGYADVIVGAPTAGNGPANDGLVYVFHGSPTGPAATPAWTSDSDQTGAQFGYAVGSAGDVNGDGFADVIVGADGFDNGESNEGRAYVYHGSASGLDATPAWTAESDQVNARFGSSVATAGDVNGDGFSDVLVGAYQYDNGQTNEGRVYVYLGSASGLADTPSWTAESDQADAWLGISVGPAGDVNGDGFSDVAAGAYLYDNGETNEGRAYVYHGSATGLAPTAAWTAESDQSSALFGVSVSTAGDVNNDGFSDLVVGALFGTDGLALEGTAYVYHGSATGLAPSAAWTRGGAQANSAFGVSVGTAGDVNGDGFSDVVVGAYFHDAGQADEGRAYVFHGSPSGLAPGAAWTAESDQVEALFGGSVATGGDVNGDGYADIVVGARQWETDLTDEGRAYLYYGNDGGGRTTRLRQLRTDQVTPIAPLGLSDSGTEFRIAGTLASVYGRTRLQLEVEVKPLGTLFDGTETVAEGYADIGTDGLLGFNRPLSDLSPGTLYHWRVRAEYDLVRTPFQRFGPWIHMPLQGWNESRLRTAELASAVEDNPLPGGFELRAVGSNPMRERATVQLVLPHAARPSAEIVDVHGRVIADLVTDEAYAAGSHLLTWNGRTREGERAGAGVYFVHARVDGETAVQKLVIVR